MDEARAVNKNVVNLPQEKLDLKKKLKKIILKWKK